MSEPSKTITPDDSSEWQKVCRALERIAFQRGLLWGAFIGGTFGICLLDTIQRRHHP